MTTIESSVSINPVSAAIAATAGDSPVAKGLILIPDWHCWSGQVSAKAEDYLDETGMLKNDAVHGASGTKWLVNRETLRPMTNAKKAFETILSRNAVGMGGKSYFVPANRWDEIAAALDACVASFNEARSEFLDRYSEYVRDWAAAHPEMSSSLIAAAPAREELADPCKKRIHAGYFVVSASCAIAGRAAEQDAEMSDDLRTGLIHEIAVAARAFIRDRMANACAGKLQSLEVIRDIADKLNFLSFLGEGESAVQLADAIRSEINALQPRGKGVIELDEGGLIRLGALCGALSDKETLADCLNGQLDACGLLSSGMLKAPSIVTAARAKVPAAALAPKAPKAKPVRTRKAKAAAPKPAETAPAPKPEPSVEVKVQPAPVAPAKVAAEAERFVPSEPDADLLAELEELERNSSVAPAAVEEALAPAPQPAPAPAPVKPEPAAEPAPAYPDIPPAADMEGCGGWF